MMAIKLIVYDYNVSLFINTHLYPYCQLIKKCFCIKPQEFNLEDMNAKIRQWFGTVRWFVQLLGGCFRQESDYPTFYHLAVLDYKPCYSQEPWLGRPRLPVT